MLQFLAAIAVLGSVALIVTVIALRFRSPLKSGDLRYGPLMLTMALVGFALAALPVVITLLGNDRDFWWKVGLFVVFGAGAVYCFFEALIVRGTYDDEGIQLKTPWTGTKSEKWVDLVSAYENAWHSLYVLNFKNGTRLRLSSNLRGCNDALDKAYERRKLKELAPKHRYL